MFWVSVYPITLICAEYLFASGQCWFVIAGIDFGDYFMPFMIVFLGHISCRKFLAGLKIFFMEGMG